MDELIHHAMSTACRHGMRHDVVLGRPNNQYGFSDIQVSNRLNEKHFIMPCRHDVVLRVNNEIDWKSIGGKLEALYDPKKGRPGFPPLVMTLSELRSGDEFKITYITTRHHSRLDRLSSLGLMPGVGLRVHQKQPTIVIQMGETQIALDNEVARDIYVRLLHHP
ncbi:MAG: FeoA family protein [Candidatus Brocadiales bacterium]